MTSESTTVVLGIPIPSTDPVFLGIVGIHVLFGLSAVTTGAIAMLSNKGRGRHSKFGVIYFWCLLGVFITMTTLSFMRWAENYHLFIVGVLSFASVLFGRTAVRRHWNQWPRLHLTGMGASYILMLTAFYVDNGKNLPCGGNFRRSHSGSSRARWDYRSSSMLCFDTHWFWPSIAHERTSRGPKSLTEIAMLLAAILCWFLHHQVPLTRIEFSVPTPRPNQALQPTAGRHDEQI